MNEIEKIERVRLYSIMEKNEATLDDILYFIHLEKKAVREERERKNNLILV